MGRQPFAEAIETIRDQRIDSFSKVEPLFLETMFRFDRLVEQGVADQGDIQNGKGDFLNDVLVLILEHRSGQELYTRPSVPGLLFENHSLDIAWPATGDVQLMVETKATGVPKHERNKAQRHPEGRAGSADLEKRIKEAAFKDVDIKGEAARRAGSGGGGQRADLTTWLRQVPPRSFFFLSVRVRDAPDLAKTIKFAHAAGGWFDGCGLFAFGFNASRTAYEAKPLGSTTIELDRVLFRCGSVLEQLAA